MDVDLDVPATPAQVVVPTTTTKSGGRRKSTKNNNSNNNGQNVMGAQQNNNNFGGVRQGGIQQHQPTMDISNIPISITVDFFTQGFRYWAHSGQMPQHIVPYNTSCDDLLA